jgi:hypothetical protein
LPPKFSDQGIIAETISAVHAARSRSDLNDPQEFSFRC